MAVFDNDSSATCIKSNKAIITIDGDTALALNVQITFQRQVTVLPTIGTERVIAIGEPQGTFSIEEVLGHDKISALEANGCNPITVNIETIDECSGGSKVTCSNCVLSAATLTAQGGNGYVAHGVQGVFTKLEIQ